jgi:hypothetical protein
MVQRRARTVVSRLEDAMVVILRARKSRVHRGFMTSPATTQPLENKAAESSKSGEPNRNIDRVALLTGGASARLAHLSDSELLTRTLDLVGKSNQVLATLLEHLAEVEARGLHRQRACASLYTYCIYELRFSEDAAARRSSAAKLVLRFPGILPAVANGEIHLTGLLLLGPHLTDENHLELLSLAQFRTKKEILKLVRRLAPLPVVPDRVEPPGARPHSQPNPTWSEFIESLCPPVRELHPRRSWPADPCHGMGTDDAVGTAIAEHSDPRGSEIAALARDESASRSQCAGAALDGAPSGEHDLRNLALRCRAHNALAAEQDFGRAHGASP